MKKIIALLFIVMILAVGCGKKVQQEEQKQTDTAAQQAETAKTDDLGVDEVSTLEEDLDISDLDELDKQLADIDW